MVYDSHILGCKIYHDFRKKPSFEEKTRFQGANPIRLGLVFGPHLRKKDDIPD